MYEKSTDELYHILKTTHIDEIGNYLSDNEDEVFFDDSPFSSYMRKIIKNKNLSQQGVFLDADIPERYGYKLISGEKKTKQRDVILRICYAARMSIEETQRALKIYNMPELYSRIPRDAFIMIAINERPGNVMDVNELLVQNGMDPLRSSGISE